jgi:hypothetical protein
VLVLALVLVILNVLVVLKLIVVLHESCHEQQRGPRKMDNRINAARRRGPRKMENELARHGNKFYKNENQVLSFL